MTSAGTVPDPDLGVPGRAAAAGRRRPVGLRARTSQPTSAAARRPPPQDDGCAETRPRCRRAADAGRSEDGRHPADARWRNACRGRWSDRRQRFVRVCRSRGQVRASYRECHGLRLRPRPAVPGRGGRAAGAAAAHAGSVRGHRRRQRLDRRHRRGGPRARCDRGAPSRGPGTAPPCTPACWPPPASTSRSWTATARSTPTDWSACWTTSGPARRPRRGSAASGRAWGVALARPRRQRAVVCWLRRRIGLPVHDIAPMRVCRRADLLALDVRDRRFGYPLELLQKATPAGWRFTEHDVAYLPACRRHPVEGLRFGARHGPHRPRLLAGARRDRRPLPGGRQGARRRAVEDPARPTIGMDAAASRSPRPRCSTPWPPAHRAFGTDAAFSLSTATSPRRSKAPSIAPPAGAGRCIAQRGDGLAERLANAHARRPVPGPVVQIGMDTPQVDPRPASRRAAARTPHDAVLGPAEDGGWWALGLRDPRTRPLLSACPCPRPTRSRDTRSALAAAGLDVGTDPHAA